MKRRSAIVQSLLVAALLTLSGCSSTVSPAPEASIAISIKDVGSLATRDDVILERTLQDGESTFLAEQYDLAAKQFPDGVWNNFGPDSRYREIVFASRGRKVVLRSWHPVFEQNSELVAGSDGIVALDGQTRDEYLKKDDPKYVAQRNAFDTIETRFREKFLGQVAKEEIAFGRARLALGMSKGQVIEQIELSRSQYTPLQDERATELFIKPLDAEARSSDEWMLTCPSRNSHVLGGGSGIMLQIRFKDGRVVSITQLPWLAG